MSIPNPAIAAFRGLLRSQKKAFYPDMPQLHNARQFTRLKFMENATAPPETVPDLIKTAYYAAGTIATQVVQGVKDGESKGYRLKLEGIELGDNESIKTASKEFIAEKENKRRLRQVKKDAKVQK